MEEIKINIDGLTVNYKAFGGGKPSFAKATEGRPSSAEATEGKPVLILHGWGVGSDSWVGVGEHLGQKGFRAVCPDLPGFGKSEDPREPWDIDRYLEFIEEFAGKTGLKSFFLVGHSFGGGLALAFSSRRPESVRMLVLCDAAVIRQERLSLRQKIAKIMSSGKGLVLSLPLVGKPIYSISQKILYHLAGVADYRRASETMKKTFISVTGQDLSGFASGVKVPVLIIWGEKDKSTPVEDAYTLQHLIPGSIVEIIKNIGHNPHRQDSERLAGLIAGFFTSN